jgi:hypothetical protein
MVGLFTALSECELTSVAISTVVTKCTVGSTRPGFNPWREHVFFSSSCPDRLYNQHCLISNGYRVLFPPRR